MRHDPKDYDQQIANSADWTRCCLIKYFIGLPECALLARPDKRSSYPLLSDVDEWLKLTNFGATTNRYSSGYYDIITFPDPEMLTLFKMAFNVPE